MSLTLHAHPLSSYCWKALVGLYETGAPFEQAMVDFQSGATELFRLWPLGRMPILVDTARGEMTPEATLVIEYVDHHYPGPQRLIPADADEARRVRLMDRVFDNYIHTPMQKVIFDRLRPAEGKDPLGVEDARALMRRTYDEVERRLEGLTWARGESFTLADCAAAPALHYGNRVEPLGEARPLTKAYLARLEARPSFARTLEEAAPYRHMFPE